MFYLLDTLIWQESNVDKDFVMMLLVLINKYLDDIGMICWAVHYLLCHWGMGIVTKFVCPSILPTYSSASVNFHAHCGSYRTGMGDEWMDLWMNQRMVEWME